MLQFPWSALIVFFMAAISKRRPLLIVSDAVSATSGLARITRDLATRIHEHLSDVYRVATLGYGGPGSSKLHFPQFCLEGMTDWICPTLPQVCEDFFGKERGIVLFIWDLSRVSWFAQPEQIGADSLEHFPGLKEWLVQANIEKWIYAPLDATGPLDRLTFPLKLTLMGFNKILAYGPFGEGIIRRTIGDQEADARDLTNLPHGIDTDVFFPLDKKLCRRLFFQYTGARKLIGTTTALQDDEALIGVVATNQERKDWALAIESVWTMKHVRKIRLWIHSDSYERYWSLPSLLADYDLLDDAVVSLGYLHDDKMAAAYSACNLTMGIGPEGFGYPLAESLACGVPVVTGSYAGGGDIVPLEFQVDPIAFRIAGVYGSRRPVYSSHYWAEKALQILDSPASLDTQYDWKNLWPRFEAWFRAALK